MAFILIPFVAIEILAIQTYSLKIVIVEDRKSLDKDTWFVAAFNGNMAIVQEYLSFCSRRSNDLDVAVINAQTEEGYTALHYAVLKGHTNIVTELLASQFCFNTIEVNARNIYGWTALHLAAQKGHTDIVKKLLAKGSRFTAFDTQDIDGRTALHHAVLADNIDIVKKLLAPRSWFPEFLSFLSEDGAAIDVAVKDNYGSTALHIAARDGYKGIVEVLVKSPHGEALACATNRHQQTALHIAAEMGHVEIAIILVEDTCAMIKAKDNRGHTALYLARQQRPLTFEALYLVEEIAYLAQTC